MKKLIFFTLVGYIASLNAQGITNTLGGNTANDKFIVENSNSEVGLIVTGEGNVGIGTTNPISKLSVGGDGDGYATIYSTSSDINGYSFYGLSTGFASGVGVYGRALGTFGQGIRGESTGDSGSGIYGRASGTAGSGVEGYASDYTGSGYGGKFTATGVTGYGVWGESTHSSGKNYGGHFSAASDEGIAIRGHATNTSGRNYGGIFRADGDNGIGCWASGNAYDFWAYGGAGVNYGNSSSIRWKNNIIEIDNPLEKLAEIRGVYFDWDEEHGGGHDVGCIAEEVGKVLPEIVVYEENGIDAEGMDYSKLTPLLIEVAKAQQKLIEELQKRVAELENR